MIHPSADSVPGVSDAEGHRRCGSSRNGHLESMRDIRRQMPKIPHG
jgi:hypothetical protein